MNTQKNMQKGFILPLLGLVVLAAIGGGLYYYTEKHTEDSTVTTTTTTTVYPNGSSNSGSTSGGTVAVAPNPSTIAYPTTGSQNAALVQVSSQGVLPQRLAWQTYTNRDYSYAISYPTGWFVSGGSSFATLTNGHGAVSVQGFNLALGTNAATFAAQNGALGGLITTKVNAYTALQTTEGSNTVYYIVNGAVGYKILVSNNLTADEAAIVRAMLIEFTVTMQR